MPPHRQGERVRHLPSLRVRRGDVSDAIPRNKEATTKRNTQHATRNTQTHITRPPPPRRAKPQSTIHNPQSKIHKPQITNHIATNHKSHYHIITLSHYHISQNARLFLLRLYTHTSAQGIGGRSACRQLGRNTCTCIFLDAEHHPPHSTRAS
jgi:hypothetical protein